MPKMLNPAAVVRSGPRPGRVTLETLAPRKRAFLMCYLELLESGNAGPGAGPDAVQAAGISVGNRNSARVRAFEFLRDPDVLAVIRDEMTKRLAAGAAIGVAILTDLALNAKSESVKLQAASQLVDRSPIGPVISRSAAVTANVTLEDMLEQLDGQESAAEIPPGGGVIDGEVIDVTDEEGAAADDGGADITDAEFSPAVSIRERWAAQVRAARDEARED